MDGPSLSLDENVRNALADRRGNWASIAVAAGVSHSWLSKFVNRHIDNPGYSTLKRLHLVLFADAREGAGTEPGPAKAAA